jgi:hypothetical protein
LTQQEIWELVGGKSMNAVMTVLLSLFLTAVKNTIEQLQLLNYRKWIEYVPFPL